MIKKRLISIIVLVFLLALTFIPSQANASPVIAVGSITAEVGDTIRVPINLSGNTGICGATISVSYDKKLVLTGIDKGEALSGLAMTKPGSFSANPVNIVWDGTDADNTNGIIAYLKFANPNENGTYSINVSYIEGDIVDGDLTPIEVSIQNGSVTIGGSEQGNENPEQTENTTISVDTVASNSGGSVDVPIWISGNTGICGATISINYDNGLTLTKITKGSALSSLAMTKPGNLTSKPFNLVWDGMEADSSNGIIATLTFTVPNVSGKYNIAVSYTEGDIVDGNLMVVNPLTTNGYIQVDASFETTVTVAGQSVTLTGQNNNGRILVAFYKSNGAMIELKTFDVSNSVDAGNVVNATKAKVLWWESMNGMKPVCNAQVIEIK